MVNIQTRCKTSFKESENGSVPGETGKLQVQNKNKNSKINKVVNEIS